MNRLLPDSGVSLACAGVVWCGIGPCNYSMGSMSIENEASISHEQGGSALAGLDGGRRRLVANSGPAVCLLSAGVQPVWVLQRAASNPVLPGLVRPGVLSVLLCPPVLPGSQRAPVLPGASVLPGSGADTDNCDWHPGCSGVLHG